MTAAITSRLFIALPVSVIGIGAAVTVWWLADGAWRLLQHLRRASR